MYIQLHFARLSPATGTCRIFKPAHAHLCPTQGTATIGRVQLSSLNKVLLYGQIVCVWISDKAVVNCSNSSALRDQDLHLLVLVALLECSTVAVSVHA